MTLHIEMDEGDVVSWFARGGDDRRDNALRVFAQSCKYFAHAVILAALAACVVYGEAK